MANAFFSFTPFDLEIQVGLSPPQLEDYGKEETVMFNVRKGDHLFGLEAQLGEMKTLSSEHGLYQDNNKAKKVVSHLSKYQNQHHDLDHQQQSKPNFLILDNFNFQTVSSQHGFYHGNNAGKDHQHHHYQQQQQQPESSSSILENFNSFDFRFPLGQVTQSVEDGARFTHSQIRGSDIVETNKQLPPHQSSLVTLEFQKSYESNFKKLKGESQISSRAVQVQGNEIDQNSRYVVNGKQKLSTEEVMKVAGARYVKFFSLGYENFYMSMHPFGYALSGLCEEETKDVELAHLLLAAAERVGYQQFERASRLLLQCEWIPSFKGTPVQKVVCYFSEALRERIEKETGQYTSKGNEEMSHYVHGLGTNLAFIACHQEVPFHRVLQFVAIQTMIENVANESRIHLIDLEIRTGVQWTGLMEAIAEREKCPVEILTITAVGVRGKQNIKETGERLAIVAKSLNLPFKFKEVIVSDMQDINDQLFEEIEDDEAVVVYAPLILRTMIARPRCLENLMRVMRNINPSLIVVMEVEANHNSPSFVNRFIDTLFFYSAFFDCLETCVKQEKYKVNIEGLLSEGIRNIVAAEGSERVVRNVKMDVWRAFFARFRMVEMSFSNSSFYQGSLMVKKFCCTTLDRNGKCLTVGWKGTPIHSLSAWKFR